MIKVAIDKEELEGIRQSLDAEAADGLAKYNKALGALELLKYLLSQLAEADEEE